MSESNSNNNPDIKDKYTYYREFGLLRTELNDDKLKQRQAKILEYALDIRKFEINLYWERTKYFTSLITGSFGGYAIFVSNILKIENKDIQSYILLLLSFIGFILSLAWYLSNRGSKYWQENWERHVDVLEDDIIGSLYKTTLGYEDKNILNPLDAYPFSVSKINQILSFIITLIWGVLFIISFQQIQFKLEYHLNQIILYADNQLCKIILPLFLIISISMILTHCTQGTSQNVTARKINFVSAVQFENEAND